jgi:hypothetical protein
MARLASTPLPSWFNSLCVPRALYSMVEPQGSSLPFRVQIQGTLFIGTTLLLCLLPSRWLTDKIEVSTLEKERVRRMVASLCSLCLTVENAHFVWRREKEPDLLFLCIELGTLDLIQAFVVQHNSSTLDPDCADSIYTDSRVVCCLHRLQSDELAAATRA